MKMDFKPIQILPLALENFKAGTYLLLLDIKVSRNEKNRLQSQSLLSNSW
jgi:hypothetical protein